MIYTVFFLDGHCSVHYIPHRSRAPALTITRARGGDDEEDNNKNVDLADRLLDYVQAGPKLRKWYGQDSLPRDGLNAVPGAEDLPSESDGTSGAQEEAGPRDFILVTDAEGPTGEAVLLQLILLRANVKALVKDIGGARTAYGPYVTPVVQGSAYSPKALRNVSTVVVAGKSDEKFLQACRKAGVPSIIVPVSERSAGGFLAAFSGVGEDDDVVSDRARADAAKSAGFAQCTIVTVGQLRDVPGGRHNLSLQAGGARAPPSKGAETISREDVATVLARLAARGSGAEAGPEGVKEIELRLGAPGYPDWAALGLEVTTPQ